MLPTVENHAHFMVDRRQCIVFFEQFPAITTDRCDLGHVTIDVLPDDVLLFMFDFYLARASKVEAWHTLVHVCRRWRITVFGSPRRLKLRIKCTGDIPPREKLDIWPALPIVISGKCYSTTSFNNIKAILKHRDRVCRIKLGLIDLEEEILAALEEPFPVLRFLKIYSNGTLVPMFPNPDKFLGGSNHLRLLSLTGISIPELLPKLLLSSTNLVVLRLKEIPIFAFVPPDEMVTALSALTRLQVLHLEPKFDELRTHPNPDWENRRLPLPTPTVLPSLIVLKFKGVIEYLEDLMARIDAPILNRLDIVVIILDQVIVLNVPQTFRFISNVPKFRALDEAHIGMDIDNVDIWIKFLSTQKSSDMLKLQVLCIEPEGRFPILAQFCCSPVSPLPTLENLYIDGGTYSSQRWRVHTENAGWLELLRPFTSVKNLYVSEEFAPCIPPALEEIAGDIVTEVLPALESLFLEEFNTSGAAREAIGKFAAARALSGHPIAVSQWDRW